MLHYCITGEGISIPVRACMDYIDLHLEDELSLPMLARLSGYSDYYVSKRFKKEVGMTPKEYIRKKRLERAKLLLRSTQADVQEISERLRFCSHSYFADAFRKEVGMSPTQWREQGIRKETGSPNES